MVAPPWWQWIMCDPVAARAVPTVAWLLAVSPRPDGSGVTLQRERHWSSRLGVEHWVDTPVP